MHCSSIKAFVLMSSGVILCSCAQMPRHSNTLVFGTNTTVGLGVGNDASSTPGIDIGFRRQEIALVPVLANTHVDSSGPERLLNPCPLPATISAGNLEQVVEILRACHFRATYSGTDRDSYSVLASFGTRAKGGANQGSVAIAQYFATGVAAQQLAKHGGANVIRAGADAGQIAGANLESRVQEEVEERISAREQCLSILADASMKDGTTQTDRVNIMFDNLFHGMSVPNSISSDSSEESLRTALSDPKFSQFLENTENCQTIAKEMKASGVEQ